MKFLNEAYDNGFLAGQNDIIDNRILNEYEYPEINSNNPDLIINQEDYGNYMSPDRNVNENNNRNNDENNQENNDDDNMDEEEEDDENYRYLAVKNVKLNVSVNDPDVQTTDVNIDYTTIGQKYGNTTTNGIINNPVNVLPDYRIEPTQEFPEGVRYNSMKKVKFNLKDVGIEINANDLQYDSTVAGHFREIIPSSEGSGNNRVDYLGIQRLTYYLSGLTDTSKIEQNCIYPPERMDGEDKIKGGIIPYTVSTGLNLEILPDMIPEIIPEERYQAMRKVTTGLNLVDVDLPFKDLSQVNPLMGLYKLYSFLCSEVPVRRDNINRIIPHSGIKDVSFHLKKLQVSYKNSGMSNGGILTYNLTEREKNGFTELGVQVQPVIGFLDGVDVLIRNVNYNARIGEVDSVNNNKVKVRKMNNSRDDINFIPVLNNKRLRGENTDPLSGEYGITIYDNINKKYINFHKYTIEQENQFMYDMDETTQDDDNIGFQNVIQNTEIPIIDVVRTDPIRRAGTFRYSISQYNNAYSLEPNSVNPYSNEFIGFDTIEVPIEINTKVVPGFGSTPNIYRPSDFDPDAIGFSSFQIEGTRDSGGGSGGTNAFNLENYTFKHNTNQPYTISQYNQQFNTNYTGFDSINVDVGEMSNLNLTIDNPGSYNLNYSVGEDPIVPNLSSNDNQFCILTGSYNYGGDSYTYYKMFDSDQNSYYSNYTQHGPQWFKIEFLEDVTVDLIKLYTCDANNGIDFSLVVSGSDDDVDYIELWSSSTNIKDYDSASIVFDNSQTYKYYKFETDGKCEIRVMQFYKYSGGYKNVNIKVDTGKNNVALTKVIDSLQDNVTSYYHPVDAVESLVPDMTGNNSNNVSIIASERISEPWRMFSKTVNEWAHIEPDKNYTPYLILQMDVEIVPVSFFMSFYKTNSGYRRLTYFKLSASKDNMIYDNLLELENFNDEALQYNNDMKYIYRNVNNENEESYLYFKLEFKGDNWDWPLIMYCKIMDVEKYNAIDKLTVVNDTYKLTSDPIVGELQPSNQRVYVNTDNSTTHPYVRRNWMTVPLEDKIINYNQVYIPGDFSVSSGYYGIKSVTFNDTNEGMISCSKLFQNNAVSTDMVNGWYINGIYSCQMQYEDGRVYSWDFHNNDLIWQMFDGLLNGNINPNNGNPMVNALYDCYYVIKGEVPFMLNCIKIHLSTQWGANEDRDVKIEISNDGLVWTQIYVGRYRFIENNWTLVKFYGWKYKSSYYRLRVGSMHFDEIEYYYCSSGDIVASDAALFANYEISVSQPGMYYYNSPIGYDGFKNIILDVGSNSMVEINKNYTSNVTEVIEPPEGKSYISKVNVTVNVQSNQYTFNDDVVIDNNNSTNIISINTSMDAVPQLIYKYYVNNPQQKSINIYYKLNSNKYKKNYIVTGGTDVKYEMVVMNEDADYYLYVYKYVSNNKVLISKTKVAKQDIFEFVVESNTSSNPNNNLEGITIEKSTETAESTNTVTDVDVGDNNSSVEIDLDNEADISSGVEIENDDSNTNIKIDIVDEDNNVIESVSNISGGATITTEPSSSSTTKQIIIIVLKPTPSPSPDPDPSPDPPPSPGPSPDPPPNPPPIEVPKDKIYKVIVSVYDSQGNLVGWRIHTWINGVESVSFKRNTIDNQSNMVILPDVSEGGGYFKENRTKVINAIEDINEKFENYRDYITNMINSGPFKDLSSANKWAKGQLSGVLPGLNSSYDSFKYYLDNLGLTYTVRRYTVTVGFPYPESGVRTWAFAPEHFNIPGVVVGEVEYIEDIGYPPDFATMTDADVMSWIDQRVDKYGETMDDVIDEIENDPDLSDSEKMDIYSDIVNDYNNGIYSTITSMLDNAGYTYTTTEYTVVRDPGYGVDNYPTSELPPDIDPNTIVGHLNMIDSVTKTV